MFITRHTLPRRTFLRGMGTAVALPFLDAMTPALARAQSGKAPVRMAFVYVPNGMDMRHWNPSYEGKLGELPQTLQPLEPHKDDILLLGNLTHNTGRALLDGAGDHGRCSGSYLTGVQVKKSVSDIKASVSCDQLVANQIGRETRFASLEVGLEDGRQAGDCDSGYSCAYTNNLAWRERDAAAAADSRSARAVRAAVRRRRGVHARSARAAADQPAQHSRLHHGKTRARCTAASGPTDQRKLDEYLSSIRQIEEQLKRAEQENAQVDPGMEKPYGIPSDFAEHFRLMTDMITVAFQADLTRVVTFLVTREGTSRAYREIGIPDGHHPLTHHRNDREMMDKVAKINQYQMEQFAQWVTKLKAAQEGNGSLLDNSMIVYGAGLADGNAHTHHDLPTLIAGRGGNFIKTGRRVVYRKETPMCNLFLTMMDRMGTRMDHFGDATGHLNGLDLT